MSEEISIIRLMDGSTVVGRVTISPDIIEIEHPIELIFNTMPVKGILGEQVNLKPWMAIAEDQTFVVDRANVITMGALQEAFREEIEAEEAQAEALEDKIQKSQAEATSCSEAIEKIRLASADCTEQLNRVRRELQMCEGERSSLEALEKAGSGQDSKAIESWLQRSGLSKEADLIDELSIEPGWELAAEAVMGDSLNAICVQEAATLKTMFSELPQCNVSVVNGQENKTENNNLESKLPLLSKKIDCSWDISTKLQNVFTANSFEDAIVPVSYTHLTLPTNREV